jgi:FtsP/CotA-like multicopper oxidase with cupredoxin domain
MVIQRDPGAFAAFGCDVTDEHTPTPDRLTPDITFIREGARSVTKRMPDGKEIEFWNFTDDRDDRSKEMWPSKEIRVRQGQIVHSTLDAKKSAHTIHHHGMNSSTYNDGVGHVSFEVHEKYTYQFQPHQAGTYFYHCHKNTVLHFEYGMYGFLIVDPPLGEDKDEQGRKLLYVDGPSYDKEYLWALDDVDPRWHTLDHDAGMCGDDEGLDRFEPKYFMITGVAMPETKTKSVINAKVGERILIRHLNASYSVITTRFEGLDATIYGVDGRPLQDADCPWTKPIFIPAGTSFDTVTAQRRDIIIVPTQPGKYRVVLQFRDWVAHKVQNNGLGIVHTYIIVT